MIIGLSRKCATALTIPMAASVSRGSAKRARTAVCKGWPSAIMTSESDKGKSCLKSPPMVASLAGSDGGMDDEVKAP